jgi:hypothetical protein
MSLGIPIGQGHVNIVENQNDSDDEVDVYIIELVWPNVKPYTCSDLKAVRNKHNEEFMCSFNICKCDRIFDALFKDKITRVTHTIPSSDVVKIYKVWL